MSKKVAFIGHRYIHKINDIRTSLYNLVEQEIKNGCKFFVMGTHGEFDKLALDVCRNLRKAYIDITIQVVITSLNTLKPIIVHDPVWGDEKYTPYENVETVMYDIEQEHFKRKISKSNQKMIDCCDTLICYVDTTRAYGGAIRAYKYAIKKGLRIVNLYDNL